jgi:hypothetical protein
MNKKIIYAFFFALILAISGCGSNEKEDGLTNVGTSTNGGVPGSGSITTSLLSLDIDKSSGDIFANVNLTSTYGHGITSNLSDMNLVLGGCLLLPGTVTLSPTSLSLDKTTHTKNVEFTGTMSDPSCVPSNFHVKGTSDIVENGQTTQILFSTNTVVIDPGNINFKDISLVKIEVLDTQVDLNESSAEKEIRIRVTKGSIGVKNKKVKITSLVTQGSFLSVDTLSDDAGDATYTYVAPSTITDSSFEVQFCLEEDATVCDTTKINLTTSVIVPPVEVIDDINYFITFVPQGGAYNLSLGSRNNAVITLIDKDTKTAIPSSSIKSITVTSRDLSILKLAPESGGAPVSNILFPGGRNPVKVLMSADSIKSGLATVEVVVEYTNKNGQLQTRGQLFSIAVLSGEATAFSINSDGVEYNSGTKQFEHKFIVQATDSSSNPIRSTGVINVSAMASFAKDASGKEILYGRFSNGISATLTQDASNGRLDLSGAAPFNTANIKEHRAFVAVFGGVDTYEANGKWNIEKGSMTGTGMKFSNAYAGEAYANLGMAVGYNYRDKLCTSAYEESVLVVDSTDGTYQLNEDGQAVVTLKHDAYMIGKRAMIIVNMIGLNPQTGEVKRSGEVHEVTLKHHLHLKGLSFPIPKNVINKRIVLWGTIDTGGNDEYAVINSTFGCVVKSDNGITGIRKVFENIPSSCDSNGHAFIAYDVNTSGDGGTVTFEKCQVTQEDKF